MEINESKWYDKKWIVGVSIFLFFPFGLFVLWKNRTIKLHWKIIISLIFVVLLIAAITGEKTPEEIAKEKQENYNDSIQSAHEDSLNNIPSVDTIALQVRAESNAKTAVKLILKAPSTAEFDDANTRIWLFPDSSVVVKGSVDAQNSFGAMLRNNFYVRMKWRGDFREMTNWTVIDAKLEE
jgi:hypothetical protein